MLMFILHNNLTN